MTLTIEKFLNGLDLPPARTPGEMLSRIALVVETHPGTWTRGSLYLDDGGRKMHLPEQTAAAVSACARGWLEIMARDDEQREIQHRAQELLARAMSQGPNCQRTTSGLILQYNDSLETSAEFVRWVRRAARLDPAYQPAGAPEPASLTA